MGDRDGARRAVSNLVQQSNLFPRECVGFLFDVSDDMQVFDVFDRLRQGRELVEMSREENRSSSDGR